MTGPVSIQYKAVGIIRSPFTESPGTPIQSAASAGDRGRVEVHEEYEPGLADLEAFSHVILVYHFHKVRDAALKVVPFMDDQERGVFSTRAPRRPNPIGISIVKLEKIEKNVLYIRDLDIVDGTPLLDIKPFIPEIDHRDDTEIGWLKDNINKLSSSRDDGRFE